MNGNELKNENGNETNRGNELEMNQEKIVEMNEENKQTLISNLKKYYKQGKVIPVKNNTMTLKELTIEEIKRECYRINSNYVPSIKLITDETAEVIVNTLKRDLRYYNDVWGFICYKNTITMRLNSNAEPVIYYIYNSENIEAIILELVRFCNANNLQLQAIPME